MSTEQMIIQQKSLALSVACGRSVRLWAKRHDIDFTTAHAWSLRHEFRELVEVARLRIADRMVGCLVRAASLAIDQLVKLCTRSASESIRLSASRTLLTFWMQVHKHFALAGTIKEMKQELKELNEPKTGEWRPHTPYEYRKQ